MTEPESGNQPDRRLSITKLQRQSAAGADLIALCQTVTEDGSLSEEEVGLSGSGSMTTRQPTFLRAITSFTPLNASSPTETSRLRNVENSIARSRLSCRRISAARSVRRDARVNRRRRIRPAPNARQANKHNATKGNAADPLAPGTSWLRGFGTKGALRLSNGTPVPMMRFT